MTALNNHVLLPIDTRCLDPSSRLFGHERPMTNVRQIITPNGEQSLRQADHIGLVGWRSVGTVFCSVGRAVVGVGVGRVKIAHVTSM